MTDSVFYSPLPKAMQNTAFANTVRVGFKDTVVCVAAGTYQVAS